MCILEASTSISDKPVSIACVFWKLLHLLIRIKAMHVGFFAIAVIISKIVFYKDAYDTYKV